jgi:hypothetical protein
MAPPSCLPSTATLAAAAKQKYDAIYGATRPALAVGIEQQAEFFFQRDELETVYFRTLIDQHAFGGPPNAGHYAVADFLLVHALEAAITTNVDCLIEAAGLALFGEVGAAIDGRAIAALPPQTAPLLKIHGCRVRDPRNMVWAPGQIHAQPVAGRIASSTAWLNVNLLNRDLLIVGYWTDWSYLNGVLGATLGAVKPARVVVVTPDDTAGFHAKAPQLYSLGQRATVAFQHVKASGADFLGALRRQFSKSFIRRVFHSGTADYVFQTANPPDPTWLEPATDDVNTLWQIRRDLEGCVPSEPARLCDPPHGETLVGLTLLQLQARGAVADGPYWRISGQLVRVLRTVNRPLHRVEAAFERELPPAIAPDVVIAVGAEEQPLPKHVVRPASVPTIARGSRSKWITRVAALEELGL